VIETDGEAIYNLTAEMAAAAVAPEERSRISHVHPIPVLAFRGSAVWFGLLESTYENGL
jgi:hypothetical protein